MAKIKCLFCGTYGERSREHAWPQWVYAALGEATAERSETHFALSGQVIDERRLADLSFKYGRLCTSCNTGWMSALESRVSAVFAQPLAEGALTSVSLSKNEHADLALWAYKTASILNATTNYRPLVPQSHFSQMFKAHAPPDGVFMDLALCPSGKSTRSIQTQQIFGYLRDLKTELPLLRERAFKICLGVGPLLIRVVRVGLDGYFVVPQKRGLDRVRRLWPGEGGFSLDVSGFYSDLQEFEMDCWYQKGVIK